LSQQPSTTVIHLAAFTDVSRAYQETGNQQGKVYQVNVHGTQNIAQACYKYHHYLIHISTDFVFDGKKPPLSGYTEVDQPHPFEWYGQTKLWAEQVVIDSGCQHVIARLSFPFRSYYPQKLDLIRNILAKIKSRSLYPMFTDQIITPTFIDDICQVLKVFIAKKPQGIYHVVGSSFLSPYELAMKIVNVFNFSEKIKSCSSKDYLNQDPRPRNQFSKVSNAKLKKDLGLTMKTIDEALLILKDQLANV
ncbi:MAG: SDR family oxidoreductase, partial [Patescibacteria group bacterium]|nr:SDR family oxidoreductase [Patescibacteria group bacterium]